MIGYYLNAGDQQGADMFNPYIWGQHGLSNLFKSKLTNDYGKDLELLLILYYLEGEFSSYMPVEPKLGYYMKDSKDIRVSMAVTRKNFHERNEFERRELIVDSTLKAMRLVKDRLERKKLDIDFTKLEADVKTLTNEYLAYPDLYSHS